MAKKVVLFNKPEKTEINDTKDLGNWIKYRRTELNYTQREVAGLCNLSLEVFTNLENGNPNAKLSTVIHVCNMLGLKLSIFVSD